MNFLQTGVFCCSLTNIDKIQAVVAKRYCMCNCVWLAVCLISSVKMTDWLSFITRISAIADGPRDATCQSNSCQLQHNSVGTTCTTSPEQIEVMELEGYSRPTYNKLVHSATTRSSVVGVIHKLTVDVDNTYTPTTVAKFSKSKI